MQAIKFKNFSTEDFTWSFNSIPYTFKAGQEMYLEDFKAKHFAKHLIDRELNRQNIPTNDKQNRAKLEALCFPGDAPAVTEDEAIDIEETKKEEERKEIKAKKGKKKVEVEEEFADLNK